jgi:hypothetical protein
MNNSRPIGPRPGYRVVYIAVAKCGGGSCLQNQMFRRMFVGYLGSIGGTQV